MTRRGNVTVERLDGPAVARSVDAFRLVYAEAFAGPPYYESEDDVAAAFRNFPSQTSKPSFRAVLASDAGGEPVGMAYGRLLEADSSWWERVVGPVDGEVRWEDGQRSFGLMELAVRVAWRGQGIARCLHQALLDGVEAERVVLSVHPDSRAALGAYRAWGYRKVGETRPWDGSDLHDVMVLDLR